MHNVRIWSQQAHYDKKNGANLPLYIYNYSKSIFYVQEKSFDRRIQVNLRLASMSNVHALMLLFSINFAKYL